MSNDTINSNNPTLEPKGYDPGDFLELAERIKRDIASGKIKLERVNMSVYGTEQLTDLLVFLGKFASTARKAVQDDGKITLGDAAKFVELIFPLMAAITGIQEVPKEFADLDPIEKEQIIADFTATLDLHSNDEATAEAGLRVIFDLVEFLKLVGVIKPVEPPVTPVE